jgi:tetratricopeptide (TPR) repeat protein
LREALAAYDQALRFYTPDTAPLAYAGTQTNRGTVLRDLASLPDEDRGARLREALAAYDQALRFYTPNTAPLVCAMTQTNRGTVLSDLASLPDEDRGARLREALAAFGEAIRLQPDFAMWHRNHADANIDLGDYDAAEADLIRAAELESEHPRLEELRRRLREARQKRNNDEVDESTKKTDEINEAK